MVVWHLGALSVRLMLVETLTMANKPTVSDLFPLPKGIKVREHRFGKNPISPLVPVLVRGETGDSATQQSGFKLSWEDREQGLMVIVKERDNGHLMADVFSTDAGLINKAALSVALIGTIGNEAIRKSIPLDVPEKDGCSGSKDFGLLTEAVKELGSQLGLIVFLMCDPSPCDSG